jgi:hypothetical protein
VIARGLPSEPPSSSAGSAGSAEETATPTPKAAITPAHSASSGATRPRPVRPRHDARDSRKDGEKKELTRELVAAKFSSARREYSAFKDRNGDRLEREWGDLATFITYQLTPGNFEDAMRRIESFRARLRE